MRGIATATPMPPKPQPRTPMWAIGAAGVLLVVAVFAVGARLMTSGSSSRASAELGAPRPEGFRRSNGDRGPSVGDARPRGRRLAPRGASNRFLVEVLDAAGARRRSGHDGSRRSRVRQRQKERVTSRMSSIRQENRAIRLSRGVFALRARVRVARGPSRASRRSRPGDAAGFAIASVERARVRAGRVNGAGASTRLGPRDGAGAVRRSQGSDDARQQRGGVPEARGELSARPRNRDIDRARGVQRNDRKDGIGVGRVSSGRVRSKASRADRSRAVRAAAHRGARAQAFETRSGDRAEREQCAGLRGASRRRDAGARGVGNAVPVDPGEHVVEARADGKQPWWVEDRDRQDADNQTVPSRSSRT